MKRSLILAVITVLTISVYSASERWCGDFTAGLNKAISEDRLILVDFYTDWCGWCDKLADDVFSTMKFHDYVADDFVLVKINAEKYRKLTDHYGIRGYPTILVLDSKGRELDRVVGYSAADEYIERIDEAAYSIENFHNLKKIVLDTNPDNRHVHFKLGEKYFERGMLKKAEAHLVEATMIDDQYSESYILLGEIAIKNGDIIKGKGYFKRALSLHNKPEEIHYRHAMALFSQKEDAQAMEKFSRFIEIASDCDEDYTNALATAYFYRGVCAIRCGDIEAAGIFIEEFEKAFPGNKNLLRLKEYYEKNK
ncbi:MAG: thioredoxin domain-containing protein [Candidatus Muiribacteriaceae bacterium]